MTPQEGRMAIYIRRREFISTLCGAAASWPERTTTFMKSLLERLNELGYREGHNMIFDYRSAEGASERLPQLAADAVRAAPDVLIAGMGTLAAKAAKAATSTIPIVFTGVGDPV